MNKESMINIINNEVNAIYNLIGNRVDSAIIELELGNEQNALDILKTLRDECFE